MTLLELWKTLDKLPTIILESTNAIVITSEGEFEIENIQYKNNQIKGLRASDGTWHDREDYPEENRWIIVKDKDGREFKHHKWKGYCYYAYVLDAD